MYRRVKCLATASFQPLSPTPIRSLVLSRFRFPPRLYLTRIRMTLGHVVAGSTELGHSRHTHTTHAQDGHDSRGHLPSVGLTTHTVLPDLKLL
ncbi:unnamed protein product [Protopolystoma xenopodis]|uniref:Uncharacterized protein n=1 Tax=Protopolystoma xenopodis TaxID=117903 RepID=A0A448XSE9_9PLAT|nr:unnamed protein product [Protopolystoma xenopodis]